MAPIHRKVAVKGGGGISATIIFTARRGKVLVSIEPLFTGEAILDPEKVDEVIRTLRQAAADARACLPGRSGGVASAS
ncbi:MAG: hypothetical protein ACRDTF_06220 [Pseudonocardiaceae bacterium]